ncbi:uncharacterized protein V1516DRAFT_682967 [Lipomyces oligophaga]|uniref:uncharacterized protein n=1 Tax=Lipomyces oligophaga TaxID=45792 RepID=UPI0034CFE292
MSASAYTDLRATGNRTSPGIQKRRGGRTGQACDRCKIRKIRCNATTESCTPCLLAGVSCTNTDLNSRRAVPRGYVENLESQLKNERARVAILEAIVRACIRDVDFRILPPVEEVSSWLRSQHIITSNADPEANIKQTTDPVDFKKSSTTVLPPIESLTSAFASDEDSKLRYLNSLNLSNKLACSCDATTLYTGAGVKMPIRDLVAPGYVCDSNLLEIFLAPKPVRPELPPYDDAKLYINRYITLIHPLMPTISRTWLLDEIENIYSPSYVPSSSTLVIFNIVFALSVANPDLYQRKQGGSTVNFAALTNTFYRRSWPYVYDLYRTPTLGSVQGLTLILYFLRGGPQAQLSWSISRMTMTTAITLGLHRSAFCNNKLLTPKEQQMRKRVFWTLLVIEHSIADRLSRPTSLDHRYHDTEVFLGIDSEQLPGEYDGPLEKFVMPKGSSSLVVVDPDRCSFVPGIVIARIVEVHRLVYSAFYALEKPEPELYERQVLDFEARLLAIKDNLPAVMKWDPNDMTGDLAMKRYAGIVHLAFLQTYLNLRHPSASATPNRKFNQSLRDISVDISRDMIKTAHDLMKINFVESTWYHTALLLTALLTILYGAWANPDTTLEEIARIKQDVSLTLDVIGAAIIAVRSDQSNKNPIKDLILSLAEGTIKGVEDRYRAKCFSNVPKLTPMVAQIQTDQYHPPTQGTTADGLQTQMAKSHSDRNREESNEHNNDYSNSSNGIHNHNNFYSSQFDPTQTLSTPPATDFALDRNTAGVTIPGMITTANSNTSQDSMPSFPLMSYGTPLTSVQMMASSGYPYPTPALSSVSSQSSSQYQMWPPSQHTPQQQHQLPPTTGASVAENAVVSVTLSDVGNGSAQGLTDCSTMEQNLLASSGSLTWQDYVYSHLQNVQSIESLFSIDEQFGVGTRSYHNKDSDIYQRVYRQQHQQHHQ